MRLFKIVYRGWSAGSYRVRVPNSRLHTNPLLEKYMSQSAAEAAMNALVPVHDDLAEIDYLTRYSNNPERLVLKFGLFSVEEMSDEDITVWLVEKGYFNEEMEAHLPNVWANERWWTHDFYPEGIYKDYTQRTESGAVRYLDTKAQRFVEMKPGKFLKKFAGSMLTDRQIAYQAEFFKTGERPPIEITMEFAKTEEEMLKVYANGPRSCMKGSDAVVAYAGGDLALCYAMIDGKILGRVLCWPDKKIYGRVYPNDGNWREDGFESARQMEDLKATMVKRLRDDGYQSLEEKPDGFDGARLVLKPISIVHQIKMPYLDLQMKLDFDDQGNLVMTKSGGILGGNTSGQATFYEESCKVCDTGKVRSTNRTGPSYVYPTYDDARHQRSNSLETRCPSCAVKDSRRVFHDQWDTSQHILLPEGTEPIKVATTEFKSMEDYEKSGPDYTRMFHPDSPTSGNLWKDDFTGVTYHSNWVSYAILKDGRKIVPSLARYDYSTGAYYAPDQLFPSEKAAATRAANLAKKQLEAVAVDTVATFRPDALYDHDDEDPFPEPIDADY